VAQKRPRDQSFPQDPLLLVTVVDGVRKRHSKLRNSEVAIIATVWIDIGGQNSQDVRMLRLLLFPALVMLLSCSGNSDSNPNPSPSSPTTIRRASFEMTARVLGPVEQDDASDLLITIRETGGVDATLHFIRLTCTNGAQQEWGAQSFVDELGSNVIRANSEMQIQRSYRCSSSARPSLLTAVLTDAGGFDHTVEAGAFHPDWPG
jgi:hypothetical protein